MHYIILSNMIYGVLLVKIHAANNTITTSSNGHYEFISTSAEHNKVMVQLCKAVSHLDVAK